MIKAYADGSYDHEVGCGAYCLVIAAGGKVAWHIQDICDTPDVEEHALRSAVGAAAELKRIGGEHAVAYSDSIKAIKALSKEAEEAGVTLRYIKGHQLSLMNVPVTDDLKRHHWCDVWAYETVRNRVKNLLDSKNLSVYNHERKIKKGPQNDTIKIK